MIRGEYWILPGGEIRFADGDVGEANHEWFAVEEAQILVLDAMGVDYNEIGGITGFRECLENDADDGRKADAILAAAEKAGVVPHDLVVIANAEGDPREYAMEKWGWKWVRGNHVSSELLEESDKSTISRGVANILEEEGIDVADFDIELALGATGKRYSINAEEVAAGNFGDIAGGPVPTMPSAQVVRMDRDLQSQTYRHMPFGD